MSKHLNIGFQGQGTHFEGQKNICYLLQGVWGIFFKITFVLKKTC